MSRTIINRYLTRELLTPFALCLLVFTIVLLAGRLVQLAEMVIGKGVGLSDVMRLLLTMLLPLLEIIIPLAFLMGIMIGFGRLSADSETIALKATGNGLLDMARPVFILAIACSAAALLTSGWLTPWGKRALRATLYDITSKQVSLNLQRQVFIKQFNDMVLYANDLDGRSGEMYGVFIVEQQPEGQMLITAESGRVHSDPEQQAVVLQLRDGVIHRQPGDPGSDNYQAIGFDTYELRPNLSKALPAVKKQKQNCGEMPFSELFALAADGSDKSWAARGELHRRFTAPLAPLLFAIFALPFSVFSQRSGRGSGFVVGLLIYLTYYMMVSLAEILTAKIKVTPLVTLWGIHLVLFLMGAYMLRQAAHERPSVLVIWADRCAEAIRKKMRRHAHA